MKKVLICFGSNGYEFVKERLRQSAQLYFDEIICYGEDDIDREFYISNLKIFQYQRGWGYWLWKPYLILKTLQRADDGDFVFYLDATAVFIDNPEELFSKCTAQGGILLFDNLKFLNDQWTKMDCFQGLDCMGPEYFQGEQVSAGIQLYQKNGRSLAFVEETLHYCKQYQLISDSPNISAENFPRFREHRHDQSILSLLAIKHKLQLAACPAQYRRKEDPPFRQIFELKRDVKLPYLSIE